ncbi:uncharacterized protein LOC113272857 [Papaver somniferum]|uniref:uncharacterized protein LOC113272857 n=1 Tax=Papaver somniferum TaxID=3469 RepID=UPI000E704641|nr:uncharacterized protein LOC113272857 [Papaver somniferum]
MDNTGQWNISLIDYVFTPVISSRIKSIYINVGNQDKLRWEGTKNGELTTKSAYRILSHEHHDNVDKVWNKIWRMKIIPRVNLFTWRMAADVLPLRENMNGFLKHVNPCCVLCNDNQPETSAHLFVHCAFKRAVWFGLGIQITSYNADFMNWIRSWFSPDKWEWKEISSICWQENTGGRCVEKRRNKCISASNTTSAEDAKHDIFYVDASYDEDNGTYGVGIIYWRDNRIADISFFSGTTTGPTTAEGLTIQKTVQWATQLNLSNIRIRIDCKEAVNFLNNKTSSWEWRTRTILKDVSNFLDNHVNIDCKYVNRACSGEADTLEKWSRIRKKCFVSND